MIAPISEVYKGYKITIITRHTFDGKIIGKTTITPQCTTEIAATSLVKIGDFVSYDIKSDPLIDLFRRAESEIDRWHESGMNAN